MSEYTLLEKIGQIAGLGGIALGVFLLIFRDVISKNIFPNLNRQQAYSILRLALILTFLIAVTGIVAWVWSDGIKNGKQGSQVQTDAEHYRRIYYQGFDAVPSADELNQMWLKGASGDWKGSFAGGKHTLCNISQSPSASFTSTFRYIETNDIEADLSNAKVSVQVSLLPPGDKYSSAGLLYRMNSARTAYYAFVLNHGNNVSLMFRQGESLKILWSKEILAAKDMVRLAVQTIDTQIIFLANGEQVGTLQTPELKAGNPGIFAYSKGCFEYDSYALYQPYPIK